MKIESSFGSAPATDNTVFRLWYTDGTTSNWIHQWTHSAGATTNTQSGLNVTDVSGKMVWITCESGGTGAAGYTATLMWELD